MHNTKFLNPLDGQPATFQLILILEEFSQHGFSPKPNEPSINSIHRSFLCVRICFFFFYTFSFVLLLLRVNV